MERHQLPLKLCWGITTHKFKGLTLSNAVIDLRPIEKVAYVALSGVIYVPVMSYF